MPMAISNSDDLALLRYLVDRGDKVLIIQDKTNPDTVLVDVTLDVPYPCNYIRLTLVV